MAENVLNNNDSGVGEGVDLQRLLKIANSIANDNVRRKDAHTTNNHQSALMGNNIDEDLAILLQNKAGGGKKSSPMKPNKSEPVKVRGQQSSVQGDNTVNASGQVSADANAQAAPTDNTPQKSEGDKPSADHTTVKEGMTSLFGFSLPTSTLYFIIACIVIAILLYYLTSPSAPSKKEKKGKKKEESEESDEE